MGTPKNSNAADVPEVRPDRGGSFVRNDDGSLTQTEGPDFTPVAPAPVAPVYQPKITSKE